MEKQDNVVSVISLKELEKELVIKETIRSQIENALQQIYGQIVCLQDLIKKAKEIKEVIVASENNKKDELK